MREKILEATVAQAHPGLTLDFARLTNVSRLFDILICTFLGLSAAVVAVRLYTQPRVVQKMF